MRAIIHRPWAESESSFANNDVARREQLDTSLRLMAWQGHREDRFNERSA